MGAFGVRPLAAVLDDQRVNNLPAYETSDSFEIKAPRVAHPVVEPLPHQQSTTPRTKTSPGFCPSARFGLHDCFPANPAASPAALANRYDLEIRGIVRANPRSAALHRHFPESDVWESQKHHTVSLSVWRKRQHHQRSVSREILKIVPVTGWYCPCRKES